jgi:hypothetical protein
MPQALPGGGATCVFCPPPQPSHRMSSRTKITVPQGSGKADASYLSRLAVDPEHSGKRTSLVSDFGALSASKKLRLLSRCRGEGGRLAPRRMSPLISLPPRGALLGALAKPLSRRDCPPPRRRGSCQNGTGFQHPSSTLRPNGGHTGSKLPSSTTARASPTPPPPPLPLPFRGGATTSTTHTKKQQLTPMSRV